MEARIFNGVVDVRFSDIDLYGHVNAKHYLDYVVTSRFRFMEESLGVSNLEILERGYKFFMRRSSFQYLKPITSCQSLFIKSFLSENRGPRFEVCFEIMTLGKDVTFCRGSFEFILVDVRDKPVREAPKWIMNLFYLNDN